MNISDDPYANQDTGYNNLGYESPNYDYNAQMPTSSYNELEAPDYPMLNTDPCAVKVLSKV